VSGNWSGLVWCGSVPVVACCRSVAVRRQDNGFICCSDSPRSGRISGAAKTEEDELLRRRGTLFCHKAGLVQVPEGRGGAPIRGPEPQFQCSRKGSLGRHRRHNCRWGRLRAPQPATSKPSAKRGKKATFHHPHRFEQLTEDSGEIKTIMKGTRIPNHQERDKGDYKGRDWLLSPNAPPWRS